MKKLFAALQIDGMIKQVVRMVRNYRRRNDDDIFGSPFAIL
jgi:hypothetical protein